MVLAKPPIKGSERARKRLERMRRVFPKVAERAMWEAVKSIETQTAYTLSGSILNVDTGTLKASVQSKVKHPKPLKVVGTVGIPDNVWYGKLHELGWKGTQTVKRHTRRITKAFGRQLKEPVTYTVPAHDRYMKFKRRPWLRTAKRRAVRAIRLRFKRLTRDMLREARK